jgi:D-alanine transfer protein
VTLPASGPVKQTPAPPAAPPAASGALHVWLSAAAASLLAAAGLLAAVHRLVQRQVQRHPEQFNTFPLQEKLVGLALQREAFADPHLLPVYGSSELTEPQQNRADGFFRAHPTGFGAFLIGNPGETCLMMTTKLAAADPAIVRGRKAVIFVSPGWFIAPELDHRGCGVNFGPLHGGEFVFESPLSAGLKQAIARRLLDYPDVLVRYPLLKAGLSCLEANRWPQRALLATITPMGIVNDRLRSAFDYARLGLWWWHEHPHPFPPAATRPTPIDWDQKIRAAAAAGERQPPLSPYCMSPRSKFDDDRLRTFVDPQHPEYTADANFERWCARSREWTDYQLLLRTAQEMGISVLVICQPINESYCRLQGLDAQTGTGFYQRLRAATAPFQVPLLTFPQEGSDPHYFQDANHPSALMWLVYDRAMDIFYHQLPAPGPAR